MNPKLRGLVSLSETSRSAIDSGAETIVTTSSSIPFLIAHQAAQHPILVVTHSSKRATELAAELGEISEGIWEFPAWETLPHERLSPNSDTVAKRISTLMNIAQARIVVTTARALVQPINAAIDALTPLNLEIGQELEFTSLIRELSDRAYNELILSNAVEILRYVVASWIFFRH